MLSENIISTIKERFRDTEEIEQIILFGSQARGSADKKSDVDLIVLARNFSDRYDFARKLRSKLAGLEYAFDIIVMTSEEFNLDREIPGTIARYASKEGMVLYAA